MSLILTPTSGPTDWRRLLGDPRKHWVRGKSAFECAVSWEAAKNCKRGLPELVADILDRNELTRDATLLIGLPEHQVSIDGGGRPSQSDLWGLLNTQAGTISMAVEAKAGEPFDKYVSEWLRDASANSGKPKRLSALCGLLGIDEGPLDGIRYQLLHRTASALLEASNFHASAAVLLIQSFGGDQDEASYRDFCSFCELMICGTERNALTCSKRKTAVPLLIGWLDCSPASDALVATSLTA